MDRCQLVLIEWEGQRSARAGGSLSNKEIRQVSSRDRTTFKLPHFPGLEWFDSPDVPNYGSLQGTCNHPNQSISGKDKGTCAKALHWRPSCWRVA